MPTINKKKTVNLTFKTRNTRSHFTKEDIQMANKYMKICSISLVIREIHILETFLVTII